jgi:hypothetical protein
MITKIETLGSLARFLWKRKLWWILPMLIIFLIFGFLALVVGSSPLAPILYSFNMASISNAWTKWKKLAKRIGTFQARIIFSILYFIVVTPLGLLVKQTNKRKVSQHGHWIDYTEMPNSLEDMKQQ